MPELGGMLAAALLKVVGEQIGSVIGGQIALQKNLSKDLEKMKMALESVEAVLGDAERRSITDKSTRLWLRRLTDAMYAISDMIDEFEADTARAVNQASRPKFSLKKQLLVMTPCLPVGPNITLAYKMKMMRENLDEITCQHKNFNLLAGISTNEMKVTDKRETSSTMDARILGRAEERDTILASLSASMRKEMMVLPIYGIGGLGKTTLAQMIYNSSQFKDYSQVWVYVSQTFDLKNIGNSIISQLSDKENETHYTEMQMIHNSLSKLISGKKILIVLDDLWEDDKSDLNKLKAMLEVGKGSNVVVIVTTRDEGIAKEISTIQPHKLALLTNDMCWSIIKHKSDFKCRADKKELKQIGKDIASKCGGVVLAAQSLGYMLQSMTSNEWKSVRDSGIWYASDSEDSSSTHVLASLRLSYSVMPSYLKLCFAYCAIFPKGQKIVKADLIHQWASLGFIEPTNVSSSWELGERYIRQLLGLSFLQYSNFPSTAGVNIDDVTLYTMHDLVHDLARSIMADEMFMSSKQGLVHANGINCHYALLNDCSRRLESSKIRALRFVDCGEVRLHDDAFSCAKSLRVFDSSEGSIYKLPASIGLLKQLKYLNAPRVQDAMFPKSITMLSKLIYLSLRESPAILALPKSIGEMESLMYLDLSGCSGIAKLPESFGRLQKLVHLDLSNCSCVGDVSKFLGRLTELQYLNLSYCINIGELTGALGGLTELQYLNLSFSSYLESCEEAHVLGSLTKLEYLNLSSECCCVQKLPEALGSFLKLKYLNLSGWREMVELPKLFGNLKNLVYLNLSNCIEVDGVPKALGGLTKLQYLNLSVTEDHDNQRLMRLPEVISNLTELRYLNLSMCMCYIFATYRGRSTRGQIESFMRRISGLSNLEHLDLSYNSDISTIPQSFCNLGKLHTLNLSHCFNLEEIPESIGTIDSLKFLYLNYCYRMSELPQLRSGSITLPRFVVHSGDGESGSNLVLLKYADPDELEITRLENVKSAEEAHSIKLVEKQRIEYLKLEWTKDAERYVDDKMLLEKLVPSSTLKKLQLRGYNSVSFPSWLMRQLPNLEALFLIGIERLEWSTSYSSGEEYLLEKLEIHGCPKLRMKPLPPRAKHWKISNSDDVLSCWGDCSMADTSASSSPFPVTTKLEVEYCTVPLHQWRLLCHIHGLTDLLISHCCDLTGSPAIIRHLASLETLLLEANDQEELPKWLGELKSLLKLDVRGYKGAGLMVFQGNMRQLTKLQTLEVYNCNTITLLPHWLGELTSIKKLKIWTCYDIKSLPRCVQQLNKLQELEVHYCRELEHLVEPVDNKRQLTDIRKRACVLPTSLKELRLSECHSIRSLPEGMQQLTNLQKLRIRSCYELVKWCSLKENKMKLAHIKQNDIVFDNY